MKNMCFTLIDISEIKDYHIHSNFESVVSGVCQGSIVVLFSLILALMILSFSYTLHLSKILSV